jgi:hypothetical protein
MSGPLDYDVRYSETYLEFQEQRWRAEQERQRRLELERIEQVRKRAEARKQKAERRRIVAGQIDDAVKALKGRWDEFFLSVADRWSVASLATEVASIEQAAKKSRSVETVQALADSLDLKMSTFLDAVSAFERVEAEAAALAESMTINEALAAFAPSRRDSWLQQHNAATSAGELAQVGPTSSGDALTKLIEEGRDIVRQAIRAEADFQARNDLLQATIESLKSLGFYVDDPVFVDPDDPLAPVTLTATRGAERVYLSVPLSGQVKSEWHGLPEANCAVHLAEYLEQLKQRGFECRPHRPDLVQPPRLLAKGAKTLPRDTFGHRSK